MRQLPGVHSSFLCMENSRTIGHVCGVMIVDPSPEPQPSSSREQWHERGRPIAGARQLPGSHRHRRYGLNITLLSYRDAIDFGVVSTPEMMPDIWNLIEYLTQELDEFHAVD